MTLLLDFLLCVQYDKLSPDEKVIANYVYAVAFVLMIIFISKRIFNFFEMAYVEHFRKKLFYNHLYFRKQKLSNEQKSIIRNTFSFYNKLPTKYKSHFEHRVNHIIQKTEFIGKGIDVNEDMKVIIAGTLVKLTFGLRDYKIKSVERVLFYPDEFYSETNKAHHKGEFNLGYKALVFSWKDVLNGYDITDDNINLAVHEFTHAIHFYYMQVRRRSTSAAIFLNSYVELINLLDGDAMLKSKLVKSQFLRDYAYTNQYEFLSVLLETFIESPEDFKMQFPQIYGKIKTMLGFDFPGY